MQQLSKNNIVPIFTYRLNTRGYMQWYISLLGDHHPETSRVLLPVGITVADMYKEYTSATPQADWIGYPSFPPTVEKPTFQTYLTNGLV